MKRSKAEVGYKEGYPQAHCSMCTHFKAGTCELVSGPIDPAYWCKLFERQIRKFNEEHGSDGRFTGPGGSHDPTGNPRGRPPTGTPAKGPFPGHQPANYGQEPIGRSLSVGGGGVAGNATGEFLGAKAGKAIGGALGTEIPIPILGTVAGAVAGEWAGRLLGGLAGDYVGAKIGASLYDIKQQIDGHAVGTGPIGRLSAGDQAALVGSYLGGTASWLTFGSKAGSYATNLAERYLGARSGGAVADVARTVGHVAADEVGGAAGAVAGRVAEKESAGQAGSGASKLPTMPAGHVMMGRAKDFMKSGSTSSFSDMTAHALPKLFGPKAWAKVEGTNFGRYVRQRVKETAEKLDDGAERQGMDLKPTKEMAGLTAAANMQQGQMHAQTLVPAAQSMPAGPGGPPGAAPQGPSGPQGGPPGQGGAKPPVGVQKLFRKAVYMPTRSSNDAYYGDVRPRGNAKEATRLQAIDEATRRAQLNRARVQPRIENLTQIPGEDPVTYAKRIQQLMRSGTPGTPAEGPSTVYRVRKKAVAKANLPVPEVRESAFKIEAELAKGLNSQIKLDKGLIWGWASVIEKDGEPVVDHQGDRISEDELLDAAHDFVSNSRQGGVLHDEYGNNIGRVVESCVFTKDLQKALGIDLKKTAWLIGYKVEDPRVKALVKKGLLKSFSIGGKGHRSPANV